MKNKLITQSPTEKNRKRFFYLGFIIVCSFTLVAFKVTSYDYAQSESSIHVPEDEVVEINILEYPKTTKTKQAQAAKKISQILDKIKITENPIKELLDTALLEKIDVTKLFDECEDCDEIEDVPVITFKGEKAGDGPVNWSQALSRTPYFDDCENLKDQELEAQCTYEQIRILVQQNTRYPDNCRELQIGGKVWVSFVINSEGEITDVQGVSPGKHKDLIAAAEEGVRKLPQMNPGSQSSRPVSVRLSIPVNFTIR